MRTARTTPRLCAAVVAAVTLVTLAACGSGDDGTEGTGTSVDGGGAVEDADVDAAKADVPEECRDPFPLAIGPADLADVTLLPDGFPDPPVDATLCLTAETIGGAQETVSYASDASAEEVLAGYESALASYGGTRDQDGIGRPTITAADGDTFIQVTPQDGGFVLAFAR